MTSLHPGLLFYATGLNKKSTPVRPETTPSEIEKKLARAPFNGRPWPRPSPVSSVYDVRNSSTRMIILNNKLSRVVDEKPKGSRLRGQTDNSGEILQPEPDRHISDLKPHTNWEHHKQCTVSVSEKFVPLLPPGTNATTMPAWVNQSQRPAMKFDNGSGVNPNHHIQCQGHMDYDIIRWYNANAHGRRVGGAQSRSSSRGDGNRALSPILNGPGLSRGERRYLSSIAKIYSVDNMRQQKQVQYNRLMWKEISKGYYKEGEWEKYQRYLNTPRKTQFGPCDPFREKRSASAPGINDSRPATSQTSQRGTARSSRNVTAPAGADRKRGQQRSVGSKGRQPARKESPLPPPRQRKTSASSLSSLEEEANDSSPKEKEDKRSDKDHSPSPKDSPQEADHAPTPRATAVIGVEEKEEEKQHDHERTISPDQREGEEIDDERSKISAREGEEQQHGANVQYHPTHGERQDEREALSDRDSARAKLPQGSEGDQGGVDSEKAQSPKLQQQQQPFGQMEDSKSDAPSQSGPRESTPPGRREDAERRQSTGKADEDVAAADAKKESSGPASRPASSHPSEEFVRLQKTPESSATADASATSGKQGLSLEPSAHPIHREGKDRPLSRLGGREQFMVVKKDRENSDDDYSDDEADADTGTQPAAASVQAGGSQTEMRGEIAGTTAAPRAEPQTQQSRGHHAYPPAADVGGASDKQGSTEDNSTQKPSDITTVEY